jgi:hypothetical protein
MAKESKRRCYFRADGDGGNAKQIVLTSHLSIKK